MLQRVPSKYWFCKTMHYVPSPPTLKIGKRPHDGACFILSLFYCGLSVCSSSFVNFVALTHMSIIRKQSLTLNCKVQSSSGSKKNMLFTVAFGLSIGISTALESATSLGRYEIL